MKFPPPASSTPAPAPEPAYRQADPAARFVFPPPQRVDPASGLETIRRVGEGLADIKTTAEQAAEGVRNQGAVIDTYGELLDRKVEAWAVPTVAPLSATINRRADPTFQLSDLMVPALPLAGWTSTSDGHWHSLSGNFSDAGRVERVMAGGWTEKGRVFCAFITPAINRAYSRLNVLVGAVTSPCRLDMAVHVLDSGGTAVRQVDIPNAGAAMGLSEEVVSIEFPVWVATQGSYIAVTFLQSGGGNSRPLLGLNDTPRPLSGAIYPRRLAARSFAGGLTVIPSSIGRNDLDFTADWFVPYAELSEDIGVEMRAYGDGFDGRGFLTRPWVTLTGEAPFAAESSIGPQRNLINTDGPRIVMWDSPMSTDQVQVQAQMQPQGDGRQFTFLAVRCTNDLKRGVGLFVSVGRLELRTWSVGNVHDIYGQSQVVAGADYRPVDFETFTVTHTQTGSVTVTGNTGGVLSWTNPAPGGAEMRFVGLGVQRIGPTSPRLYGWSAKDISAESETAR